MNDSENRKLVPYKLVGPGYEARYTGEKADNPEKLDSLSAGYSADQDGNVYMTYPLWTWTGLELEWDDKIILINRIQENLGHLSDTAREIRALISSLAHCDAGFPVTVDQALDAIGNGVMPLRLFHNGCFMSTGQTTTQPGHIESLRTIHDILTGYMDGRTAEDAVAEYPFAKAFISRTYDWLGPVEFLGELQLLFLGRILLPLEFFTNDSLERSEGVGVCFGNNGKGAEIDAKISAVANLPKIHPDYTEDFKETLHTIEDLHKRRLYRIGGALSTGLHQLSDCHHSSFRWIEQWIHAVGNLDWGIPSRKQGVERIRLRRSLFGYILALDKWLAGIPQQFLLLDMGHIDLGYDPKNEILRVYALLGEERTKEKEWLAACLWYHLHHSLHRWNIHRRQLLFAESQGVELDSWLTRFTQPATV